MTKSFTNFMSRIIDYAGMFPPANLELEPAFSNYLEYKSSDDNWMMDKFVCTMKSFESFLQTGSAVNNQLIGFNSNNKIEFSLLLTGGNTTKEFLDTLQSDLKQIKEFINNYSPKAIANAFEVKLPPETLNKENSSKLKALLNDCLGIINEHEISGYMLFLEPPVNSDYSFIFEKLAYTIAESNINSLGFKLRTGGITPELFPATGQVALALKSCNDNKVKFKATAGLHHPVRHYNDSVSTKMHGFLNVFGAGILAYANNLSLKEIEDIIIDENPSSFKFTDSEFLWNDIPAGAEIITKARNEFVNSFGSCSFEEPKDDLKQLKLL